MDFEQNKPIPRCTDHECCDRVQGHHGKPATAEQAVAAVRDAQAKGPKD